MISAFAKRHEKNILVASGSRLAHSEEKIQSILKFAEENSNYGLVVSLSKHSKLSEDTKNKLSSTKNILLKDWVPQRQLLQTGSIDIFLTHGGYNSIYDSLEASVPLLVSPITHD